MHDDSASVKPQQHFPMFWRNADWLIRGLLRRLGIERDDAESIASDLIRRLSAIRAVLPVDPDSQVHRDYGSLLCDAITAEQHLFVARAGRMPGAAIGDWPPTPLKFTHPFLIAVQCVVSEIEVDACRADGGRRLN